MRAGVHVKGQGLQFQSHEQYLLILEELFPPPSLSVLIRAGGPVYLLGAMAAPGLGSAISIVLPWMLSLN